MNIDWLLTIYWFHWNFWSSLDSFSDFCPRRIGAKIPFKNCLTIQLREETFSRNICHIAIRNQGPKLLFSEVTFSHVCLDLPNSFLMVRPLFLTAPGMMLPLLSTDVWHYRGYNGCSSLLCDFFPSIYRFLCLWPVAEAKWHISVSSEGFLLLFT